MQYKAILMKVRALKPHKAIHNARFEFRNVLTNEPFDYVDLWLRRQHCDDALFYWRQSRAFYRAAQGLPIESSPLVLYYCFMNAAKALLAAKNITFGEHHGLQAHRMRGPKSRVVLSNEGIKIKNFGIAPTISSYFGEMESRTTHSLEDVLYNIVSIHRTFCLSYPNSRDMFLSLKNAEFVRDQNTGAVHFRALVTDDVDWRAARRVLPVSMQPIPDAQGKGIISNASILWFSNNNPTPSEMNDLRNLNMKLRTDIYCISGANTLWYLKTKSSKSIRRQSITLMLAAMHRLSEICRYRPSQLLSFLNGQKNWLLNEFVTMTPSQLMNEIACEMTGHQIMIPNARIPI